MEPLSEPPPELPLSPEPLSEPPPELPLSPEPLLKYDAKGLIPCVVQQYDTGEVLMVAWMNEESVGLTLKTGTTWFWSRSRQELWNKGATSGNMQQVKELWADCDSDTLLVKVDSPGPACHTGNRTCFFKKLA